MSMSPIVALIISKVLDYLSAHADEIIEAIKDKFLSAKEPDVQAALQNLGYEPNEANLIHLSNLLEAKGEDPAHLAAILVNKTLV